MFNFRDNQFLNRNVGLGGAFAILGIIQNAQFAQSVNIQAARMGQIITVLKNGGSMTPQDQEAGLNQMTFSLIIDAVIATRTCLDEMYQIRDRYVDQLHELHQDTCSGSICCVLGFLIGAAGIGILGASFSKDNQIKNFTAAIVILSIAAFFCLLTACLEGGTRLTERNESRKFTRSIEAGHQKVTEALLEAITKLGVNHQALSDVDMQRINEDERFPSEIKTAIFRAAGIEVIRQEGTCTFLSNCCARIFGAVGARNNVAEMVVYSPTHV